MHASSAPFRDPPVALRALDAHLLRPRHGEAVRGLPAWLLEWAYFGAKQARACLFALLFFAAVFLVPRSGLLGLPRYDVLLLAALAIQAWMLRTGLESRGELRAICLFHAVGFGLEAFKTSAAIGSWSYPDPAWSKLFGVPLFSGFMYAAVGSYVIQAWRLLDLRIERHPRYWMATGIALLIYANFFSHHFIGDFRGYIAACALGLYARAQVVFRPYHRERRMPLLLAFALIGLFIWLAENLATFLRVWSYPEQLGAWSVVHVGKWSSWSLLVMMTITIVAHLQHVRARIHVAP
jgi:uncharacterized membrane protein YoaT (DUF817 family)